jgi:hypothetical protein
MVDIEKQRCIATASNHLSSIPGRKLIAGKTCDRIAQTRQKYSPAKLNPAIRPI